MLRSTVLLAACLTGASLSGPGCAAPRESAAEADNAIYASRTTRDRIGRILAPVMINGQGPFRFVVDTGATHSVIAEHLAARLGLDTSKGNTVLVSGVTGSAQMTTVRVAQLQAGALRFDDHDMPVIGAVLPGADGILGIQGFHDKTLVVDFARDRIRIIDSRYYARGLLSVPVDLDFNRLLLAKANVSGVPVKAIIDTGAERSIGNMALREALRARRQRGVLPTMVGVQGVTAEIQEAELLTAPNIRMGDLRLSRVAISYGDLHVFDLWKLRDEPALLLGMDALGILDLIVVDYPRGQVHFKPRRTGVTIEKIR